jgi:hypothetical protein
MPGGMKITLKIDKKTERYFSKTMPEQLKKAKENAVEAMGKVWADDAKMITRDEGHVDTGLYVNSIGYTSGSPATAGDIIHDVVKSKDKIILKTGSNVAYAGHLEKQYGIMAEALDTSQKRMSDVAKTQIKKTLGL